MDIGHWYIIGTMLFGRKKPKRLYVPTASKWYTRPRRRKTVGVSRRSFLRDYLKSAVKNITIVLLVGGGVVVIGAAFFFSSYFSITNIDVARENLNIDSAAIENQIQKYKGENLIFTSMHGIEKEIMNYFPEFEEVNVKKTFPDTLTITLKSYPVMANLKAYYHLPQPEPDEETVPHLKDIEAALDEAFSITPQKEEEPEWIEQKGLLNAVGQALFNQEEDLELITIVINGLNQPIEDREQVVKKEYMVYMMEAIDYIHNLFDLKVREIEYLDEAREMHVKMDNKLVVWITFEKDFKEQIDKWKTIYEPVELNRENIAYIDLRVREKVIYCPRGNQCDH